MKIAMFTETYLPNLDGVVRCIVTTKKKLEEKGHDVYIFTPGSLSDKRNNKDKKVFYHIGSSFPPYPQYKIALFPYSAQPRVQKLGIDLIHTHGMATMGLGALQAKVFLGKPMIGTFHTLVTEAPYYLSPVKKLYPFIKKVSWSFIKWYFNQCGTTVAPSTSIKAELEKHGVKNVVVNPGGVEPSLFNPGNFDPEFKKRFGVEGKKVILYQGRLAKEKNLHVALEVVRQLDDSYRLLISGDGPYRKELQKLAQSKRLGSKAQFLGRVDEKTLKQAYASSDCFIFPSTFETQGLVAAEAMASGIPVVGANSWGIPDVIEDGKTGFLAKPNDVQDFKEKVVEAIERKEELGRNGLELVLKHFTVDVVTDRLVQHYEKLVKK